MPLHEHVTPQAPLRGEHVVLEPLEAEHAAPLWELAAPRAGQLFRWFPEQLACAEEMRGWVEHALDERAAGRSLPFVQRDRSSGRLLGSTRIARLDRRHGRAEIGWTWLVESSQGGAVNSDSKLLLLDLAFGELELERIELRTDSRNARSRAAILALGATQERVLRHHMQVPDGSWRDTVVHSILAMEWPRLREALVRRRDERAAGVARSEQHG